MRGENPILNVLARQPTSFESFQGGRAAAEDQRFNALRQQGMQSDLNQRTRVNALADDERKHQEDLAGAEQILSSPTPAATLRQLFPHLYRDGVTDQEVIAGAQRVKAEAMMRLGQVAPKASPLSSEGKVMADVKGGFLSEEQGLNALAPSTPGGFSLNPGEARYDSSGKLIASREPSPQKAPEQFVTMSSAEIAAAGLPAGTSAQKNSATGEIRVISKRDNTGSLSQKDATTAKQKITTIRVARKQIADIKKAFNEGRDVAGPNSFGPGQGMLPTERGKKFDASVDRMRSTLTALTRVPGVGAMSDYETKLDQGKFPNRNAYESVTTEQIQGIEDLLDTIERGYTDLLSGSQPSAEQPSAQPEITATGPNGEKLVLRNGQWVSP